jgi:peptidoglycan L-alanyl-D-glutamate endopeptidase CwlK
MIPMVTALLEQCEAAGIPCDVVQSTRTMSEQERIYNQGRTSPGSVVSHAKPGDSYHNYGLAVDIVPRPYRSLPNWNPEGPLWDRIGAIGKSIGLEWGGDWSSKDLPHFQLTAAPLSELKAYWNKFKAVMPIAVTPSDAGLVLAAGLAAAWFGFLRPQLKKRRMLT